MKETIKMKTKMKIVTGDWFVGNWEVGVHVANLYHTFGSGIARSILQKFPKVYDKDIETPYGDENKLGTYSSCVIDDGRRICNLYAMERIGNNGNPLNRNLKYDHFYDGFYKICSDAAEQNRKIIGVPYLIGCCRAGGNWNIVNQIMMEIVTEFDLELRIYKIKNYEKSAVSTPPKTRTF
jgi:hypothetical protein